MMPRVPVPIQLPCKLVPNMDLNRRSFFTTLGSALAVPRLLGQGQTGAKPYGSGYFGEWIEDEFGLPAFRYTCDQVHDPKAVTAVKPGILSPTDHVHQVGNDRLIAVVSNYGVVQVRQDEGAPEIPERLRSRARPIRRRHRLPDRRQRRC